MKKLVLVIILLASIITLSACDNKKEKTTYLKIEETKEDVSYWARTMAVDEIKQKLKIDNIVGIYNFYQYNYIYTDGNHYEGVFNPYDNVFLKAYKMEFTVVDQPKLTNGTLIEVLITITWHSNSNELVIEKSQVSDLDIVILNEEYLKTLLELK